MRTPDHPETRAAFHLPRALLFVALAWAAIYLPALGSLEIKGEEGRRILPAVTMLETGDWIVPHVGGEPYLSKPPLINWLIAGSFKTFGVQNEWAARAPSVLAVLALALGIAWRGGAWLGPGGGMIAALFTLTNVGLMEKGRLAEIEALYIACFGLALVDWLAAWRLDESPWRRWLLPAVFLGLGLLTKGPLHVLFFYAIVGSILWRAGRLRAEFLHPAHLVGVALMLAMFAAWAVPYWQLLPHNRVGSAWSAQFTGRMKAEGGFRFKNWIQNIPRGLFNFIPWAAFLPLLWRRETDRALQAQSPTGAAILRGARPALAVCFLAVLLLPGGLPRYALPLLVPAALLVAQALGAETRISVWLRKSWLLATALILGVAFAFFVQCATTRFFNVQWRLLEWLYPAIAASVGCTWLLRLWREERVRLVGSEKLALFGALTMAIFTFAYALAIPRLHGRENLRAAAARTNAAANGESVIALAPGYQPFLFYLRPAPRYARTPADLPADSFVLVKNDALTATTSTLDARGTHWQNVLTLDEKNRGRYVLLRLGKTSGDNR